MWFVGLGVALTSPVASASAEDDPAAELAALGARCFHDAAGETIGVDLSNTWVTDADLAKLARLPQLESINLAYTKITDQGLEHLAPLKNVKVLDLYYAESVTDLGIAHLKHWKNLEHLNVRGTKVTSTLFEHIAQMTNLRFLDVGHSRVNDDLFELLESLDHLEHLSFGGNKMSGAALPLLKSLPALKELSVSGQQRTDSGLWSVSVTDFNIGHIAQLPQLEVLDLGETNVSDRGIAELARLKNLHTLDLRATRVTSKGIAALSGLPKLRHLKLWKARGIDDAAVPVFLRMESLEVLELPETSITAQGLAQLSAKTGLETALHRRHRHHAGAGRGTPRGLAGLPGELVEKADDREPRAGAARRQLRRRRSDVARSGDRSHRRAAQTISDSFFSPVGKPPIGAPTTSSARVRYRSPTVPVTRVWRPVFMLPAWPAAIMARPAFLCELASACSWTYSAQVWSSSVPSPSGIDLSLARK